MFTNPNLSSFPVVLQRVVAGVLCVMIATGFPAQAGDILRRGTSAQAPGTVPVYGATAATTAQARANANDTLARTTQALEALRAMQNTARNLALGQNNLGADPNHPGQQLPNVPNGLATGGLVPDSGLSAAGTANPVTTWTGATTPTQTTSAGQTTVKVVQNTQQAVLNWQTFNIGLNTALNIDQSAGGANANKWIAFNIVKDPSGIPSQILGSINAIGQVYVINQNGIIFGGASQVNVHTLVASSLPINTNLIALGLLNNPDEQFLFSQVPIVAGANGTPAFTPPTPDTPSGLDGDVTVQAGAQLSAPTNAENVGGRIALIGPNVTNAGTISTPDGQTILAAGNQVGMAAHSSNDPSLRGLDVYVGSVDATSGNATNSGVIDADRADVTITGKTVNQLGGIDSTTSVTLNGRIDLLADYGDITSGGAANVQPFLPTQTGAVTLGAASVTQILPELDSTARVVGTELALSSLVNIQGKTIYMAPNATLLAPGATTPSNTTQPALDLNGLALTSGVTLNAGEWLSNSLSSPISPGSGETFVHAVGQVYLDTGAIIDVAGSVDVDASVAENIVEAQLRGAELANSSLQREGILRGQSVSVDILQTGIYNGQAWIGSPLANLAGYAALVEHTVGELTVDGGSVSLIAGNSTVMQPGSAINVSGGWVNYQGAMVQTTKLISGGRIYDISQAPPNLVYQGILNGFTADYSKWGITETFGTPLIGGPYFEAGYLQGGNGGSITIKAPSMALDGNLLGNTAAGPRQRAIAPVLSALSLIFQAQDPVSSGFLPVSPAPPEITLESSVSQAPVGAFAVDGLGNPLALPNDRQASVILSPDLLGVDGFGALTVSNSDGNITVPVGVSLTTAVGGSITLSGANIDIQGNLSVPSGVISLTAYDVSPFLNLNSTPTIDPTRGTVTLGGEASLSTAGLLVNDLPGAPSPNSRSLVDNTNGGTITIDSYNADLAAGSVINVSGGAALSETSKGTVATSYGSGGRITINTGHININGNDKSFLGGQLVLDASLEGYSGGTGGTLSILAPLVQIGGTSSNADTLLLSPDFFNQGGFTSFNLSGLGAATSQAFQYVPAVEVAPGTVIAPHATGYVAVPDQAGDGGYVLVPTIKPEGVSSPVSLAFNASGVSDPFGAINPLTGSSLEVRGDIVIGQGASIVTDPQTNPAKGVTLSGQTVAVLGSITVPGGSITITGAQDSSTIFANAGQTVPPALPTVDIGPQSILSTAGTVLLTPDPTDHGYRTGSVLAGGSITISGNIVAENGAVLDVSGATGVLDLPPAASGQVAQGLGGFTAISTRVDSNAGSITLAGAQELFTDATLLGNAGGPSAAGGSLVISSGINGVAGDPPLSANLIVTQSDATIPAPFYSTGQTAIGNAVVDAQGNIIPGMGYFAADSFNNGGFYSLVLKNTVEFSGPVNITAKGSLTVATGGVIYADSAVTLTAPYVALGQPFLTPLQLLQQSLTVYQAGTDPFTFAPVLGAGSLTVNASLIDIGNLSLQGISNANFFALNGDIRGDGTLDVAGNILMDAGQVYPPTEQTFTIAAYNHGGTAGTVTFESSGVRSLPMSAGGTLNVYAAIINQGGVLRAPLGTINLGWDGAGTAPIDPISGSGLKDSGGNSLATATIPVTQQITLCNGSITSVSAIDPITGLGMMLPYGINLNGTQWIDPAGNDITTTNATSGVPAKVINISAVNVSDNAGAVVDLRGGGDLYAYRFVSGTGGSSDILGSTSSYAILPGYQAGYAPYAPYNPNPTSGFLGGDPGYVNPNLAVGDRIYLSGGDGLAAGYYTLLPARYALLPGAYLVTPSSGQVASSVVSNPDGSLIMPGYRSSLGQTGQQLFTSFEVDSQAVVQARAEYDNFSANSYLAQTAVANNTAVPRLPVDSGQLVLQATQSMSILGTFDSQAPAGGRGALVDINSSVDILINSTGVDNSFNGLVLDASNLTAINAESLLIGGIRETGAGGTTVTVNTNNLTVDNQGSPLAGTDIILVANDNLTLAAGAEITATGALSNAETLHLGNFAIQGSGDGTLLRVSSDSSAQISRSGVSASTVPHMSIGAGATITGASITLDSTYGTALDSTAIVSGQAVNLDSGQISIQLTNPGIVPQIPGLMLSGEALQNLQASTRDLSLLSYSSIDIYGTGQVGGDPDAGGVFPVESLALHAAEIRGFNNAGGTVTFAAQNIILDNSPVQAQPLRALPGTPPTGSALVFDAGVIQIGASRLDVDQFSSQLATQAGSQPSGNQFNLDQNIDQYASVTLNASGGILARGTIQAPQQPGLQGATVTNVLNTQGSITLSTPLITGATGARQTIAAGGAINIVTPTGDPAAAITGGLGANISLQGSSVTADGNIALHSGVLTLHATAGDVQVGGTLDVSGETQNFIDLTGYTSGGQINLTSDTGGVTVGASGVVNVSSATGGGDAGTLAISAPTDSFTLDAGGQLLGHGGTGGQNGTFILDVETIPGGLLSPLATALDAGGFTQSITIRDRGDSSITVDGMTTTSTFNLSSDKGSITVSGTIDASGTTGGVIALEAHNNLVVQGGAKLTVAGQYYNDAGQGGAITLEAGDETNGTAPVATQNANGTFSGNGCLDIQAGSEIDLGVAHQLTTSDLALGNTTDNRTDLLAGTLHLRAPQTSASTDLQINPINGTINNASSIVVEGYKIFTPAAGSITTTIENNVLANGNTFAGANGTTTAGYTAMQNRLFSTNPNSAALETVALIEPGAEIINTSGNLTLASSWDLSTDRFGPKSEAGDLTLRASGNLVFSFGASLSDGFVKSGRSGTVWTELLMPVGSQSWSYRLVAGADFAAADFRKVQPLATLVASNSGSLLLGQGSPALPTSATTNRSTVITTFFQTIRTGVGTIDIDAGQDVQLLNPVATIYTAGSQAAPIANFDTPVLTFTDSNFPTQTPTYPAQYSMDGGNVTISAQNNIAHYVASGGTLAANSSLELPDNWLYRQGWIDPTTGQFGATQTNGNVASTSWWVDYSNFFEGVGALGGGNVTLTAGHDITNVDAVVPTNARMPKGTPDASALLELGGGDLLVKAGNNISGGVYYVERGQGAIEAGNDIITNSTRAALAQTIIINDQNTGVTPDPTDWLPTTLFLGKGSFDVSAGGDLLLGPVANPFLLPQGINNSFLEKTYFSTYSTSDTLAVSSLTGDVTIKNNTLGGAGSLLSWIDNVDLSSQGTPSYAAISQPWLRLVETSIPSTTALELMPSTLDATAFSGDINLEGSITLSPSPRGNLDLAAAGSINGVQPNGSNPLNGEAVWASSTINLSDANPNSIPGIADPVSFSAPSTVLSWDSTDVSILAAFDLLFNDSGSTIGSFGVLQTQQALHAPGILHAGDPNPVHLSANTGDISGVTLYSPKETMVVAGQDITDVSLYIQNDNATDISVVSAGRDVIAYDPNSSLRTEAQQGNNELAPFFSGLSGPNGGSPTAGDIQISGPGTLEVLAGRNLNLGVGPNNPDGTGVGIASIGNSANPNLPFGGASIVDGAGIGGSAGLSNSQLDYTSFIAQFLNPTTGGDMAARYLPDLATILGMDGADNSQVWSAFGQLPSAQQDIYALDIFYAVLRDAGRDHNKASSPGFGNYAAGFEAIADLFPGNSWQGDVSLTSREIKTTNGGDISIFAPGGNLNVGLQVAGTQAVDQGILTEDGGNISIFTEGSVNVGTSRIFTLRGGSEIIWSSGGDIAAGASSKTVQSAPPTRVLVDPQSGNVETDLAGLATGGGIGVLDTVVGIPVGDVDLIAPAGTVDAGDAGIRATGNLNIAAVQVLNATNISVGGASTGTPAAAAAPNIGGLTAGSNTAAASNSAANDVSRQNESSSQPQQQDVPSVISVEVLGYGGGGGGEESMNEDMRKKGLKAKEKTPEVTGPALARSIPPLAMNAERGEMRHQ